MTTNRESTLFEFADSKRPPTDEEEQIVTDMHAALGMSRVPIQLMHPPAVKAAPRWNRYVLAVAALLMVFALGRASFMALQSNPGGVPTDVPPVVLGLASQAPATPTQPQNDSAMGGESCFESGPPLILYANGFPVDVSTVIITEGGDLKLRCAGTNEEVHVSSNVVWAQTTGVAETILVAGLNQGTSDQSATLSILNLRTGDSLTVEIESQSARFTQAVNSPWYVAPSTSVHGAVDVIDLRTLEHQTILEPDGNEAAFGAIATSSDDGSLTAIGLITEPSLSGGSGVITGRDDVHPEILVLRDTLEGGVWLSLDSDSGSITELISSPDGQFLALGSGSANNAYGYPRQEKYALISPATGEMLAESEVEDNLGISSGTWSLDSKRFIYSSADKLKVLEPGSSQTSRTILTAEGGVEAVTLTTHPDIVLIDVRTPLEDDVAKCYRVSIDTGETTELGLAGVRPLFPIVNLAPLIVVSDGTMNRYVDSATGEEIAISSFSSDPYATPPEEGEPPTIGFVKVGPVYTGTSSDSIQIWTWNEEFLLSSTMYPDHPEPVPAQRSYVTPDGRFVISEQTSTQWESASLETVLTDGPPRSLLILDTMSPTPTWILLD